MNITPSEYVELAVRTENKDHSGIIGRLTNFKIVRLFHAFIGMVTEVGELAGALKKYVIYGRPLDVDNVLEEIGDLLWYVALALKVLDVPMEQVMLMNIAKLQARFGEAYSDEKEKGRNYAEEAKAAKIAYLDSVKRIR